MTNQSKLVFFLHVYLLRNCFIRILRAIKTILTFYLKRILRVLPLYYLYHWRVYMNVKFYEGMLEEWVKIDICFYYYYRIIHIAVC